MKDHPNESKISFIKGSWFIFEDEGNSIALYGSVTGKEKVYFNNSIVSEKQNMSTCSTHKFNQNGNEYELTINIPKPLRGQIKCVLLKNGKVLKKYVTKYVKNRLHVKYPLLILFGAIYGFLHFYFSWPIWALAILFFVVFISSMFSTNISVESEE